MPPPLTCEDKALIKVLRVEKGCNVDRIIQEFPARQWKRQTLYNLVRKIIDQTGSTDRSATGLLEDEQPGLG